MKKKSIKALRDAICNIQTVLNKELEYLNSGGCIHFAYYFSNTLSLLDIPHKIYLCNKAYDGKVYRTYRDFEAVSHVLVYVEGIGFFDGHKFFTPDRIKNIYTYVISSHKFDLDRLRRRYCWNWTYNADEGNPIIIDTIKNYLDDYTG